MMEMADEFAIPDGIRQAGRSYQWVVTEVQGEPPHVTWSNYGVAIKAGWAPVPAVEHLGGCVLMERPSEMVNAATKQMAEYALERQRYAMRNHQDCEDLSHIATANGWMPTADYRAAERLLDDLHERVRNMGEAISQIQFEITQMRQSFGID